MRARNSSSCHTVWRTGLTKSISRAPNSACSTEDAHCMKYQAASFWVLKLLMPSDQIQTFGVGSVASGLAAKAERSEEHTSELQSLMRISYAVFCLKKKKIINHSEQER